MWQSTSQQNPLQHIPFSNAQQYIQDVLEIDQAPPSLYNLDVVPHKFELPQADLIMLILFLPSPMLIWKANEINLTVPYTIALQTQSGPF